VRCWPEERPAVPAFTPCAVFAGWQERLLRLGCDSMRANRARRCACSLPERIRRRRHRYGGLSLDTTAVMLTPVLLALVKRLKIPAAPYVVLCAFIANVGSMLLPISNLTNLLFSDAFHQTFAAFAARMIVPQLVALVTTYAILRWHFRHELPSRFANQSLPDPASVVPNHFYFVICIAVLSVVLVCYFLAPLIGLEPYVFAFAASAVLAIAGLLAGRVQVRTVLELSWDLFPFVIGLSLPCRGLRTWHCRPVFQVACRDAARLAGRNSSPPRAPRPSHRIL